MHSSARKTPTHELAPRRRRSDKAARVADAEGLLISDLDAVLWEADPDTFQFKYVSEGAERLLGFPVSAWIGEQDFWARHIHPDDRDQAVTHCLHATRAGLDHEFQYRMVAADGSLRTVRDFVRVQVDDAGRPRRLFGVIVDVTDRQTIGAPTAHASEGAPQASRAKARILLLEDDSDDAQLAERHIRKAVPDCVILRVMSGHEFDRAVWEFAPDVIISDHMLPAFGGRDALRLARARSPETPFILLTGSLDEETAVEYMKAGAADYVLKDRIARLGHTVIAALDRRRQGEAYARAEAQYRDIFLRAPVGIARATADGQLVAANPELARMLGYDKTIDLSSLNIARDIYVNAADRARLVEAVTAPSGTSDLEVQWKKKDGSVIWVQLSAQVEREPNGQVRHIEVFARDVSEQKQLAAQLRQAQRMEAIGQLAGGVAHDFNNILTVVLSASELALTELAPTDALRADIEEIRKAARLGAELTRQLLAFSRKQVLAVQPLDLNAIVRNVEGMLRRLLGSSTELRLSLAADLGMVLADRGQVEQVLMNLVVNARDAMSGRETGTITITTSNHAIDAAQAARHVAVAPGQYVLLSVTDTGVGMDAETRARIFEPFFTTKEPGKGTGLGLSTVYGIVQQSGGHVGVASEVGSGTTITASLPRIEDPGTTGAHPESAVGTETILLAEDDRVVRALAHRILASAGYAVIEAESGADALRAARAHAGAIHLLVTDVVMPEMNGLELSTRLVAERPGTRVLYISGYPAGSFGDQVISSRDQYLLKPFSSDALRRKVREALDARGEARATGGAS